MDTTLTTVQMTAEDALMFVAFQKRYAFMKLLESIGAFDVKNGSVQLTINFDTMGAIGSVEMSTKRHYRLT